MSTRARCSRCGYCDSEDLREAAEVVNSTTRTWGWCDVCLSETTHWVEELAEPVAFSGKRRSDG